MDVTFKRSQLQRAFQLAQLAVPAKSPKAILKNVVMSVDSGGRAEIRASDLEIHVVVGLECQTSIAGEAALPAALFGSIIRDIAGDTIRLNGDKAIRVTSDRSEFKLQTQTADDFPSMPVADMNTRYSISGALFRAMLGRTAFAIDPSNTKFALSGVSVEFEDKHLVCIATDGRRLAKMDGPAVLSGEPKQHGTVIIPERAVRILGSALEGTGEAEVMTDNSHVIVRKGDTTIAARLVDGRFPRWQDIVNRKANSTKLVFPCGPLLSIVRQANILTSEESKGLDFTFSGGNLTVSASTAEVGESKIEMPISYDGEPVTICLAGKFVLDALRVLEPEANVTVEFSDSESTVFFTTDDRYEYLVMPMATN